MRRVSHRLVVNHDTCVLNRKSRTRKAQGAGATDDTQNSRASTHTVYCSAQTTAHQTPSTVLYRRQRVSVHKRRRPREMVRGPIGAGSVPGVRRPHPTRDELTPPVSASRSRPHIVPPPADVLAQPPPSRIAHSSPLTASESPPRETRAAPARPAPRGSAARASTRPPPGAPPEGCSAGRRIRGGRADASKRDQGAAGSQEAAQGRSRRDSALSSAANCGGKVR